MLRILLIILVALAVIIGLMRLTGAKPGDGAPTAVTEDAIDKAGEAAAPAEDVIIDEPAIDALPSETGDAAATEPALEEIPAEMAPAAPGAETPLPGPDAGPSTDPAPPVEDVLEEPQEEPQPDAAPGR